MGRNALRSIASPPRAKRERGERKVREDFAIAAAVVKEALASLIAGEGITIETEDGSTRYVATVIPVSGTYSSRKDFKRDAWRIAYEGIRRYGVVIVDGEPRYARIPGTKTDDRRFSNAFSVLPFGEERDATEENDSPIFQNAPTEQEDGTYSFDALPIIVSIKMESVDGVSEWSWNEE